MSMKKTNIKLKTKEDVNNFIENIKQETERFTTFLDSLDYNEIKSVLKSNYIKRATRNWVNHLYLPTRVIRDSLPLIAVTVVANIVMYIIRTMDKKCQ